MTAILGSMKPLEDVHSSAAMMSFYLEGITVNPRVFFFSLLLPHEIGNTCLCGLFHRSAVFLGTSPFLLLCGDQGCSSPFTSSFISGYHGIEAREMPYRRIGRIPWEKTTVKYIGPRKARNEQS